MFVDIEMFKMITRLFTLLVHIHADFYDFWIDLTYPTEDIIKTGRSDTRKISKKIHGHLSSLHSNKKISRTINDMKVRFSPFERGGVSPLSRFSAILHHLGPYLAF